MRGLDWVEKLPWSKTTSDELDIIKARQILEKDHYGLTRVKKRILEFLAVRKLKKNGKGPILCFIGPPGTGKTSIGESIAKAMGRKFVRISLGGVYDEAHIRGHGRTYVAALPGVIISNLKKAGVKNPVFMIDEIDKIGTSVLHGDPSSALLEALDPEQNYAFVDHYLKMPFDLSEVIFITTGNTAETIQPALKDRMEILGFTGYTIEEKIQIAKGYLIPRQMEENGLKVPQIEFEENALWLIIKNYTKEAGVRKLERQIGACCRKTAVKIAAGEIKGGIISGGNLSETIETARYYSVMNEKISGPGIARGLAWTPYGGEIHFIEAKIIKGAEPELEITGHIEKIMQESIRAALTLVEANYKLPKGKIHIHVPEGSTPKDGPSAGLAVFAALVSLVKKQKIKNDVAMTGEITLRGTVLPVGGIKEKILAAKEAGIKTVILPRANEREFSDLPETVKEAIKKNEFKIIFVSEVMEALEFVLEK